MQTQEDQLKQAMEQAASAQQSEDSAMTTNEEETSAVDTDDAKADIPLSIDELQAENISLKAQLEKVSGDAEKDHEQLVRAVAEAMNMKKRAEADVERERKFGNEKIIKALLPVVDSLDLALTHTDKNNPELKTVAEGIENTMTLFLKELKNFGVERLNPVGQAFDPNLHQAITMVPSNDVKPNHILSVMQKGFVLNGRVVRPAMVVVAKAVETKEPEAEQKTVNIEA
ncbi:MAG: nucleotide exchange factor GrpE [Succinivibrio sp.]|nr:nucleotide exchange factor GrpE [Succinivibrio sp.]